MAYNENILVKKPHSQTKYSEEQLDELEKCMHLEAGPLYFMSHYIQIQHPVRGQIQFLPYDYQQELIHVYNSYRFSINMLSRQLGKTTCAAGYLLWFAMFKPDSTILIAAHKYDGSQEIMQRVRYAYEHVPDFIRSGAVSYNKGSIDFDNGSRILSTTTTENTGRGLSLSLIYLDEFAFVPPRMADEFWTSISPTLAEGGKCIITSTPNSDDDTFATIWREANSTYDQFGNESEVGRNGFKGFKVVWDKHPDRDDDWAEQERSRVGEERFRREHLCEFIIYDETLIDPLKLTTMLGVEAKFKTAQTRWYKRPVKGGVYLAALDPSLGTGGDYASIEVYEATTMEQVAEWQHNKTPINRQVKVLQDILTYIAYETNYDSAEFINETEIYWSVENNTVGEAALVVIADTGEDKIPGHMMHQPKGRGRPRSWRKGFTTTPKTKMASCAMLKNLVERDKLIINSRLLTRELKNYVASGTGFEAKVGEHDDCISATLIVLQMIHALGRYDSRVQDQIAQTAFEDDDVYAQPLPFGII